MTWFKGKWDGANFINRLDGLRFIGLSQDQIQSYPLRRSFKLVQALKSIMLKCFVVRMIGIDGPQVQVLSLM